MNDQDVVSLRIVLSKGHRLAGRVVDVEGQPIPGVAWELAPEVFYPGAPATRGLTDEEGQFEVVGVDAAHGLTFSHSDYATQAVPAPLTNDRNAEIVMQSGGVFRGQVVNAGDNQPITNFKVSVSNEKQRDARQILSSDGRFEKPAGRLGETLSVRVVAEGYQSLEKELESEPLEAVKPVTKFALKRADLVVAGIVQDSEQRPWAGVQLSLMGAGDPEKLRNAFFQLRFGIPLNQLPVEVWDGVVSDTQGRFRFEGIAAEQALGLIGRGDEVATELTLGLENYSTEQLENLKITLTDAAVIQGKVSAKEYPEARGVLLTGTTSENRLNERQMLDEDRSFSFGSLPAGRYLLMLNDGSYSVNNKVRKNVTVVPKEVATVNFGEEDGSRLSGMVLMAGRAVPNGLIFLIKEGAERGDWRTTHTDGGGLFQFEGVSVGNYSLVAYRGDYGFSASPQAHPNRLTVNQQDSDQFREFQFQAYGTVRGNLVAKEASHLRLRGKTSEGLHYFRWLETGPGPFEIPEVSPGIYSLSSQVWHDGQRAMRSLAKDIVVPEDGSDVDLGDVGLSDEATLNFRFSGDESAQQQEFYIELVSDAGDRSYVSDVTAAIGARQLLLVPGTYTVRPSTRGPFLVTATPREITLVSGDEQAVQVHIQATTYLIFNSSNKNLNFESATFTSEDGRKFEFSKSPPDNSAEVVAYIDKQSGKARNLPSGAGRLVVIADDGTTWEEPLVLKAGSTLNIQVFKPHLKMAALP